MQEYQIQIFHYLLYPILLQVGKQELNKYMPIHLKYMLLNLFDGKTLTWNSQRCCFALHKLIVFRIEIQ